MAAAVERRGLRAKSTGDHSGIPDRRTTRDTILDQIPYAYCGHDPVNWADPSGHTDWGAVLHAGWDALCTGVGAAIGGAVGTPVAPPFGTIGGGILGGVGGAMIGEWIWQNPDTALDIVSTTIEGAIGGVEVGLPGLLGRPIAAGSWPVNDPSLFNQIPVRSSLD